MRIIHVSPYFNFPDEGSVGGALLYVYELSKALVEKGHEVAVFTSGNILTKGVIRIPKKTLEEKEKIEVHRVLSFEVPKMPYLFPHLENPIPSPSFFSALSKEYDIIHVHGHEYATSFIATLAAKKARIPTILTIHNIGEALEEFSAIHLLRKALNNTAFAFTVNSAKTVIAPTEQALHVLREFKPKNIIQVRLGIDFRRFENLNSRLEYVLFLGRLEQTKRPEDFIKVIPLVLKKIDANFVVAGSGIQFEYLKKLVENLKLEKYVKFIGWIPYHKVPAIIANASLVVAPGGAGYSIMEAAAAQKPIVSGKLDWNIGAIGKGSALFVEPGDIKNLADAIVEVLTDQKLAESIAEKARMYVENHESWDVLIERFINIYDEVLGQC